MTITQFVRALARPVPASARTRAAAAARPARRAGKPRRIDTRPAIDRRSAPDERIAAFDGGLISVRHITDDAGTPITHVTIYQLAAHVAVSVEQSAAHHVVTTPGSLRNRH